MHIHRATCAANHKRNSGNHYIRKKKEEKRLSHYIQINTCRKKTHGNDYHLRKNVTNHTISLFVPLCKYALFFTVVYDQ
jgi:hypothetical protein